MPRLERAFVWLACVEGIDGGPRSTGVLRGSTDVVVIVVRRGGTRSVRDCIPTGDRGNELGNVPVPLL